MTIMRDAGLKRSAAQARGTFSSSDASALSERVVPAPIPYVLTLRVNPILIGVNRSQNSESCLSYISVIRLVRNQIKVVAVSFDRETLATTTDDKDDIVLFSTREQTYRRFRHEKYRSSKDQNYHPSLSITGNYIYIHPENSYGNVTFIFLIT